MMLQGFLPARQSKRPALKETFTERDLSSLPMRAIWRFWRDRQEADRPPSVAAIDPLALPRLSLGHLVVVEVIRPGPRFRSRLVGSYIVDAVGRDNTGRFIDEVPGMEAAERRLRWCVENRRPYFASGPLSWSPADYQRYNALGLPFVDATGEVARILVAFDFDRITGDCEA